MIICVSSPFPSASSIIDTVMGALPSTPLGPPALSLSIPAMPSLPSPVLPGINNIHHFGVQFAAGLKNFQLVSVISAAYDLLSSIFSLPFPSIPGLPGIDFGDILSGSIDSIVSAITGLFNGGSFSLPFVPSPLLGSLKMPSLEILLAAQLTIESYMYTMANLLFEMVNGVADKLKLPAMPAIPAMPSLSSIMSMLPDISLSSLSSISIPGFPISLSLPSPLIPGMNSPSIEFIEGLKTLYNDMANFSIKLITDFITDTLKLGLSLPTMCLPLSLS